MSRVDGVWQWFQINEALDYTDDERVQIETYLLEVNKLVDAEMQKPEAKAAVRDAMLEARLMGVGYVKGPL